MHSVIIERTLYKKKIEKQEEALKPFTLIHESFLIIN
jgi:hypothetical protein